MNLKERTHELDKCVVYRYDSVSSGCANPSPKLACVIYMHNWEGRRLRYETATVAPLAQPVDYSTILSHSSPLISSRNNAPAGTRDWLVFVASGCYPYPLIIPVARPVHSLLHPRRMNALTICIVVYFFCRRKFTIIDCLKLIINYVNWSTLLITIIINFTLALRNLKRYS